MKTKGNSKKTDDKDKDKDDQTTTAEEQETALLSEVTKAVLDVFVKGVDDDDDDDDKKKADSDDEGAGDDDGDDDDDTKSSNKVDPAVQAQLDEMKKSLAEANKEISRLKTLQSPESQVIGKDVEVTMGDLAEMVATAATKAIAVQPTPSGKKPVEKNSKSKKAADEFGDRSDTGDGEEYIRDMDDLEGKTVDEVAELITSGEVPHELLEKALGEERIKAVKDRGLRHIFSDVPVK